MTTRQLRAITSAMITWAVLCYAAQNVVHCQIEPFPVVNAKKRNGLMLTGECKARDETCAIRCSAKEDSATMRLIVIGFVGGLVKADDVRRPEVPLRQSFVAVTPEPFMPRYSPIASGRHLSLEDRDVSLRAGGKQHTGTAHDPSG